MTEPPLKQASFHEEEASAGESLDPRVLSSVLVSVKMAARQQPAPAPGADPQERLLKLMHSPEIRALLDAGQIYVRRERIPAYEGLTRLVTTLQAIDQLWTDLLLKEGLARLNGGNA